MCWFFYRAVPPVLRYGSSEQAIECTSLKKLSLFWRGYNAGTGATLGDFDLGLLENPFLWEWNLLPPWPQEWSFSPGKVMFLKILSRVFTGREDLSLAHRAAIPTDNDQVVLTEVKLWNTGSYWGDTNALSTTVNERWTWPWTLLAHLKNVPVKGCKQLVQLQNGPKMWFQHIECSAILRLSVF